MIIVPNGHIKHNGVQADLSTKATVYLPELTAEQNDELYSLILGGSTAGIVIMSPEEMEDVTNVLKEASMIKLYDDSSDHVTDEEEWSDEALH